MPKCTGHSSQTGKPCDAWAIRGGTVCVAHGGRSPQVRNAAKARLEHDAAEHAAAVYGLPVEVDPHTALLEELWRTAGHVAWLRTKVAALEEEQLHGPVGGGPESIPREEPHVWVRLYQEERKHLAGVARDCIRAGIEERRVTLAEQQGALLAQVIKGILTDLEVPESPEVGRVVKRHLTLASSG